ncbi:MAG: hypothetical protein ACT4ON_10395 [Bacteroidota bacterium]
MNISKLFLNFIKTSTITTSLLGIIFLYIVGYLFFIMEFSEISAFLFLLIISPLIIFLASFFSIVVTLNANKGIKMWQILVTSIISLISLVILDYFVEFLSGSFISEQLVESLSSDLSYEEAHYPLFTINMLFNSISLILAYLIGYVVVKRREKVIID